MPHGRRNIIQALYYVKAVSVRSLFNESILKSIVGNELLERISDYDHERIHSRLSRKRLIGTTKWFLEHPDFKEWLTGKTILVCGAQERVSILPTILQFNTDAQGFISRIWQNNDSVSLATFLLSVFHASSLTINRTTVVEAAKYRSPECTSPTLFFYCDQVHHQVLDQAYIISSLIKQFCEFLRRGPRQYPEDISHSLRKFFGSQRTPPDVNDLQDIFLSLFTAFPDTIYIIDGIDTLQKEHAKDLLIFIRSLFCSSRYPQRSRILLLSRDQVEGYINIDTFIQGIRKISTFANVTQDITLYIESCITEKSMFRKLTDNNAVLEEITQTLLTEASDMYSPDPISLKDSSLMTIDANFCA